MTTHRCYRFQYLLVYVFEIYCISAFSLSRTTGGTSLSFPSLHRFKTLPAMPSSLLDSNKSTDRARSNTHTGHDRKDVEQILLPLVKEYHRIHRILNQQQPCKTHTHVSSTPRLYQAILCGYVSSDGTTSSSDTYSQADGLEKFERVLEEGPRARELVITSNMGLVHRVVDTVLSSYCHVPVTQPSQHSSTKRKAAFNHRNGKKILYSMTRQDLVQEGALGLARAIEKYDATLGSLSSTRFSTYAYYWIRAAVLRAIAQKDELVRVPEHVSYAISKIVRAANRLGLSNSLDSIQSLEQDILNQYHSLTHNYLPIRSISDDSNQKWEEAETAKRLANEAGVSLNLLKDALTTQHRRQIHQRLGGVLSLEPWMMTTTSSVDRQAIHDDEDDSNNIALIKESLSKHVNQKEMEALCLRYGLIESSSKHQPYGFRDYEAEAERELFGADLSSSSTRATDLSTSSLKIKQHDDRDDICQDSRPASAAIPIGGRWGEAMSFAEVGKQMKISAEYGRRLCTSALKKLKEAADDGRLDPALLYL